MLLSVEKLDETRAKARRAEKLDAPYGAYLRNLLQTLGFIGLEGRC
jgi:hypothetical protein